MTDTFYYSRVCDVGGSDKFVGSVCGIKHRCHEAIVKFRMRSVDKPNYLVLGRAEWAEYQGMVQYLQFHLIKDSAAQSYSFCGLPLLQSLEELRLEAVK